MIKNGKGGDLTKSGLRFEEKSNLKKIIKKSPGYTLKKENNKPGEFIYYNNEKVGRIFIKNEFYAFLKENNIEWKKIISKRLIPDQALLVIIRDTLFVLEIKYQTVAGSVDEKLQTCDFKRKQYLKLVQPLQLRVEYVYILNDWFKKPEYKDTLDYIISVNCFYHFNTIPLSWFGFPILKQ